MQNLKSLTKRPRRVVVLGGSGAGKSTLAGQFGRLLGLPVFHLDLHYWQPGWQRMPDDEFDENVKEMALRQYWVIEGNYKNTLFERMQRADLVVVFDLPLHRRLYGALSRWWRNRGKDIFPGCPNKLTTGLFKAVWRYRRKGGDHHVIMQHKKYIKANTPLLMLKSYDDVATLLAHIDTLEMPDG